MTRELRWRILTLQIIVTLVLAFGAGVCYWAHSFTHDQVRSQLASQQIAFPPAASPAIKALPAADATEMAKYGGQTMADGNQARVYAEHFIVAHLREIGQGKTYAYWSGKALAEEKTNPKQFAVDNGIALTLFRGETLRALLLNAWAFWFVGDLALYGAVGMTAGALAVFLAFLFEFAVVPRREGIAPARAGGRRGATA